MDIKYTILYDSNNEEIGIGDIIKREIYDESKKCSTSYYLYDKNSNNNKPYLFKYDDKGNFTLDTRDNIYVDSGVTLARNDTIKWFKIGKVEEVFCEIFDRLI
jgi:hypothetical protein